jgi:hypothetical protein
MRYIEGGYVENITGVLLSSTSSKKQLINKEEFSFMKKLLVLVLSVVMVLSIAAIAMADPTITINGELAVTDQWGSTTVAGSGYGRLNGDDTSNVKITAALNDDVSAVFQIDVPFNYGQNGTDIESPQKTQSAYFDNSYIQVKNVAGGIFKIGKTGWQAPGLDINERNSTGFQTDPNGDEDNTLLNAVYAYPVADTGFTVTGGYQFAHNAATALVDNAQNVDGMFAVDANYTKDQIIGDVFYNTLNDSYDVLVGYKLTDAFTVKAMVGETGNKEIWSDDTTTNKLKQFSNDGVVLAYADGAFKATLEYDGWAKDFKDHDSAEYVRVAYTFANGFGVQYDWNNDTTGNKTTGNQIMAFVKF